jgi:hypothetical protein
MKPKKVLARRVGATDGQGHVVSKHGLRAFKVGEGLPNLTNMRVELQDMTDVLLGRVDPPMHSGTTTLLEVADAYFARASEMTMLIQQGEAEGRILKTSAHYKFRTGELRTFLELAKRSAELGSRRLTYEQMKMDAAMYGRNSRGPID